MEPQAKRFAGVCDSDDCDVDQVIAGRVPQATKEATSGWLRVFHQFADKQETRLYTNHSVRATVVHRLSAAGTPERHNYYVCDRSQECTESPELCQSDGQPARPNGIGFRWQGSDRSLQKPGCPWRLLLLQ